MEEEKNIATPVEAIQEEEKEPKVDLTEEEAKVAAENVGEIIKVLDYYKNVKTRREARFNELKEKAESLPEGHYKRTQLAMKMLHLARKINPKMIWNSREKGTYRKEKSDE